MKHQHEGEEHDEGDEVSQQMGKVGMQKRHGRNADQSSLSSGDKAVRKDLLWGDDFQKENGQDAAGENENERDVPSIDVAHRPSFISPGFPSRNPSQRTTGCGGYFGNRESVCDNWQSRNREPLPETISRT